jgi:hypothetical protein
MSEKLAESKISPVFGIEVGQVRYSSLIVNKRVAMVICTHSAGASVWIVCRGARAIAQASMLATMQNKIAASIPLDEFEEKLYKRYRTSGSRKVVVRVEAVDFDSSDWIM